jgi:hypothetical protein
MILPAALMFAAAAADVPPTAELVIARTTAAVGGERNLRALSNLRLVAEWTENGTAFRGDYRATRDGRMRIDVYVDGSRVFSEGIDSGGAWEQRGPSSAPASVGEAPRNALAHRIAYRFDGIWFAREHGRTVTLAGRERVDEVDYQVVKLGFPDGFETYFYVNPATWLIERQRDRRAYHPSNDATRITVETVSSDFRPLCGVQFARASRDVNLATGATLSASRVVEARCNVADDQLDISRPATEAAG